MNEAQIIGIASQTLYVSLLICGPILAVTLVVGLAVSVFQAVTQINEMTLTFIPKLLAAAAVLLFTFPWMIHLFQDYFLHLVSMFRDIRP